MTDHKLCMTDHREYVTDHKLCMTDHGEYVTDHRVYGTNHGEYGTANYFLFLGVFFCSEAVWLHK